jgi:hypothetical protein
MSTLSPTEAARTASQSAGGISGFFRNVWTSFKRHSEMQVMLSSGYSYSRAQDNFVATHFDN